MKVARFWVPALALCAVGCASAPPPQPVPHVKDSEELRTALETATLSTLVVAEPPKVDVQAAASIPIPEHPSIRSAVIYFTTELKSDMQQSLIRSAQCRALIDRVLDEAKLPMALAYLPVIESAYLQTLTSRAGARGMWQFMPETAREYGLRVDRWVDERADPDLSTRAAAAYLKDLYREFQDWPLALAAYNAGPRRIHQALEETHSSTFWDLLELAAIPRETRGYVPTFFASLIIASDPAGYGFRLSDPVESDVRRVEVEGPLSLRAVAKAAGLDETMLRDLNPMLLRGKVPRGRMTIRVPSAYAEKVARALGSRRGDHILSGGM